MTKYHYHTATRTILADIHTPVGVYMRLRDVYPQSALLESSDYHGRENSRSFIAFKPLARIEINHGQAQMLLPDGSNIEHKITESYTVESAIQEFISYFEVEGEKSNLCGLYGYTSFDAVRYFEHIPVKSVRRQKNDAPDVLYILFQDVIAFDHFNNRMTLVT
ncbi:MAG: anthranilate synthase component I family protein, partial [Prevotella sp.]|nr:anthranilate synthase component I family protein [Prevotella sp.]